MPGRTFPTLYAILDLDAVDARGLSAERVLDDWLQAGIRLVQLRAKGRSLGPTLAIAETLAGRCREAGATFVVNDRADVARLSRADGVHVGQTDLTPAEVRRILRVGQLVGLSTHNDGQVVRALDEPVNYLAIGPVSATHTKAEHDPPVGIEGVRSAAALVGPRRLPLVAIGGITLDAAPAVLRAGADAVAVVSDLLAGPDPADRARRWVAELRR